MQSPFKLDQQAFAGLPKNIWLLSLVMLINRSGTMVLAFLTLYCTQYLHQTPKLAGFAIAVYGLGSILGAYFGGRLSDKFGYHFVQVSGLIGGGVFFILAPFAQNFHLFLVIIFLLAAVNESFRPANTAAIAANSTPEIRTRSFALLRLAMNLGWSVGTFLGGILSHYDYKLLFYVDGCTSIFAGLMMLTLKFKTAEIHKNHLEEAKLDVSPLKNKPFVYFILGTLLYTFCFFQLFTNVPLFYKVGLKLDEQIIGIVMSLNGLLIVMIEMVLVNNIEGKFSKKSIIVTGTLLMVLFYFLNSGMNLMNAFLIAFGGMLIITFGEILSLPFMNSYYLKFAGKTNTGKYASIYMMTWSIGQILAGYIGGMIINSFGFPPLWLVCTGLSLLCAFIYFKVIK